ncbi:MAG: hypothetical protein MI892_20655 [Desulfobacterales bacterium]|nr:hypothetical protein [Desulfobacterales bacterium]
MSLPPPDPNGRGPWIEYKIGTPAFQLRPFEKPDMSPYLVHMTAKNSILGILNSGEDGNGIIKSNRPLDAKSWYDESVVCFTESPIFAIDAFRYIRFKRWQMDLRYGVGFSKERLIEKGVRPALYFDSALVGKIRQLSGLTTGDPQNPLQEISKEISDQIMPLMNSLMENETKQGFIWEREWRYPGKDGFQFDYDDIEIICCPNEEREKIVSILGDSANKIKFVESWSQYNEVKEFLDSRSRGWETEIQVDGYKIDQLKTLKNEYQQELNKAEAYKAYTEKLQSEMDGIKRYSEELKNRVSEIESGIKAKQKAEPNEKCCNCGRVFDGKTTMVTWNDEETFKDALCGECYAEYRYMLGL